MAITKVFSFEITVDRNTGDKNYLEFHLDKDKIIEQVEFKFPSGINHDVHTFIKRGGTRILPSQIQTNDYNELIANKVNKKTFTGEDNSILVYPNIEVKERTKYTITCKNNSASDLKIIIIFHITEKVI